MKTKFIFLTGFMGSGKTTIGKKLADKLNMPFYDTDAIIEQKEKMTIAEIFVKKGEKYFRNQETITLREITSNYKKGIVSTGGGIVMNEKNIEIMKNSGIIVFLYASFSTLFERIKNSTNRPLVKTENLYNLYQKRLPFYEKATLKINTDDFKSVDEIVNFLLKKIKV